MTIVGDVLLLLGVAFAVIGSIGIIRLPDFYSRTHAATKPDTLGLVLCMTGLVLHHGLSITSAKLVMIAFFVAIANPPAVHALGRAALRSGLRPWVRDGRSPDGKDAT